MSKQYDDMLLVEAYRKYRRCRIVAEMYGCSDETVRRALIKANEPRIIRNPRKVTPKHITQNEIEIILQDYYDSELTINELAKKYHRSQRTISKALKEQGSGIKYYPVNGEKITDAQLIEESKKLDCRSIAVKYGISEERIFRRAKNLGIKITTQGSGGHWKQRATRYGTTDFDDTITLKKVIEKYHGICQICGMKVNPFDVENGHIKRMYPTVDHIKPLSKGGSHTWDNIQLAHMCCNAGKCDKEKIS